MDTKVTISAADFSCATTDGRTLQLKGQVQASMALSIAAGNVPDDEDPDGDLPWTALAATFEFADCEGNCWRITSRFGSELLVRTIMDFSSMSRITVWDDMDLKDKNEFDKHVVLKDIWFSSDDRFIRPLIVGDSVKEVQFKYFGVSFDLAVFPNTIDDDLHLPDVFARTTIPIYDYEVEEIPSLYFPVDWRYFLVNTYCMKTTGDSDIPIPFIAEKTDRKAEPQSNVSVANAT
jgi:hypothetical protein